MHAFRCKTCGHLVTSAFAGEARVPTVCPVCKVGVRTNWEVLADTAPERLAELGLSPTEVERHTPVTKVQSAAAAEAVCQQALAHHEAKRQHWDASKDKIVAEFRALDEKLTALDAELEGAVPSDLDRLTNERDRVRQRMQALADLEPSQRDREHEAHCRAFLAGQLAPAQPRTLSVRARDGAQTKDRS